MLFRKPPVFSPSLCCLDCFCLRNFLILPETVSLLGSIERSSLSSSTALAGRSAGSFESILSTSWRVMGEMFLPHSSSGGRVSSRTFAMTLKTVSPANGMMPDSM